MAKKKTVTKNDIIACYMDYVLEHNQNPKTVYAFAKMHNFEEAKFYQYFASFEAIETGIFAAFFSNSVDVLNKNDDYSLFDARKQTLKFLLHIL